jgi:hypothetical protein
MCNKATQNNERKMTRVFERLRSLSVRKFICFAVKP